MLGVSFANQARALINYLRAQNLHLDGSLLLELETYPVIGPVARLARDELSVNAADIQEWMTRATEALAAQAWPRWAAASCCRALGTLVGFFFMLFLLFFFLRDGAKMFEPPEATDPGARGTS